jgi:ABC-2 type transport system permease protein
MRAVVRRYLRLLQAQLHIAVVMAAQYRADFLFTGLLSLAEIPISLIPLFTVFYWREGLAGWSLNGTLLVMAWFTMLRALLDGAVNPSLSAVVEHIRQGTLDFVLLKPADAQFLVSTSRLLPWKVIDALGGVALAVVAFWRMGHAPTVGGVVAALGLLVVAAMVLYSIWILVVAAAFWVVKIDNLSFLFSSIFDAARWPIDVFPFAFRIFFTFVVPLALMTTYPARAVLGTLSARGGISAAVLAGAFVVAAREVWRRALSHYSSASS